MKYLKLFENFEQNHIQSIIEELDILAGHVGFEKSEPIEADFEEGTNIIAKWTNRNNDDFVILYEHQDDIGGLFINFYCDATGMSGNDPVEDWLEELMWTYIFEEDQDLEGLDESKKSGVTASLKKKSKASGIPMGILRKVFAKGMQAWNAGHRPGVAQHQWAFGRVNSFITGAGGARKADAALWTKAKAVKARKKKKK